MKHVFSLLFLVLFAPTSSFAVHEPDQCQSDSECKSGEICRPIKYACGPDCTAAKKVCYAEPTPAVPKNEDSRWFECEQDSDCVDIRYSCSGGTVNKKYKPEAGRYYQYQNSIQDCHVPEPKKDEPPFRVFCKQKKCGSEGRNPKPGFS